MEENEPPESRKSSYGCPATTDAGNGVELIDETMPPVARTMARNVDEAPETTASLGAPTSLTPKSEPTYDARPAQD